MTDRLIAELEREADATRRVLERVPDGKFAWKPHPKSMSLGQLALHIASLPQGIASLLAEQEREIPTVPLDEAESVAQLLSTLDESIAIATEAIAGWGAEGLAQEWRLTAGGETILARERGEVLRTLMLNHWYHHRGQLTVYLRLLDVPVPGLYGPSADDEPGG